jgi:predicted nucleic acid-binding protein
MIFVDTSAWYAAYVPSDKFNRAVLKILNDASEPIVTSDFVVDETMTLLRIRGEDQRALSFGKDFLFDACARVEMIEFDDLKQAYQMFSRFRDKAWSFTDCTSYVVMKRLSINNAVSLDNHFRQMPGITVATIGP